MKLKEKLSSAVKAVNTIGSGDAEKSALIDSALHGGHAFNINKGINVHLGRLPAMYGKKSLAEMLGMGDDLADGRKHGHSTSVNFGVKKFHIDDELRMYGLEIKKQFHNCLIIQQMTAHKTKMPVSIENLPYFKEIVAPMVSKAFDLAGFSNWVPTLNTRFFFEEFEIEPGIEKYFEQIPMMSKTEQVPGAVNRLMGRLESDSATFGVQSNTQAGYTYTAQDCVGHTDITEDLMQDMNPASGGFDRLRKQVALAVARAKEYAILNGDDTGSPQGASHMDSDIAADAATNFAKAFKGLRKIALAAGANNTVDNLGARVDRDTFAKMLNKMGKMAKDKGDLVFFFGPSVSNRIVTGDVPELLTLDTFGAQATIITGNLPRIFGIASDESEWIREDLNASGVYASASAFTTAALVKKSRFVIGQRAPMKIWATPSLANQDKMLLTAKERFTFAGVPQSTPGERSVVLAYNIAL
jgi:hypothetical protein